jgi:membrane-associated protease RseP (regulator of RpoE activity)
MQTEHKEGERQFEDGGTVTCPNCRTELVVGLRFCRMCGFRLGEGLEEYNETRRFDPSRPPCAPPAPAAQDAPPYARPGAWTPAPMAHIPPVAPLGAARPGAAPRWRWTSLVMPWRWGWVGWVVLSLVIMVAVGAMVNDNNPGADVPEPDRISPEREVDAFETADGGGAFITGLSGPNSSLERAGLRGGDTITSFDGRPVRDARALRRILRATPVGKTVEIIFLRDGKTITTTLTTEPAESFRGDDPLDERPGGQGRIGANVGSRVRVPTLGVHGVELDGITRNGPADLAGLKRGDIVIEFNGKPTATAGDLRLRIFEAVPGETVIVKVLRGAELLDIPVKVGRSRDD